MWVKWFPFGYYAALYRTPKLPTIVREKTWGLEKLFLMMEETKAKIKELMRTSNPSAVDIQKLKGPISQLAVEIQRGIRDLKYISFYDSTMFYLYYRLMLHVLNLCQKEEERLAGEEKQALSDKSNQNLKDIKNAKRGLERQIKAYERLIKELKIGEKQLIKDYKKLVEKLRKLRWDAEKQAQHEFTLLKLTLRGMRNLNRKIKVEAIKVKTQLVPQETFFLRRIERKGPEGINPEDVIQLAKLVSEAIERVSKDVVYSFKLISKFENEMKKLKRTVEKLKKKVKNIRVEGATDLIKPIDDAVKYVEEQINKDLMGIFRNIFVEYKYIATRPPRMAA